MSKNLLNVSRQGDRTRIVLASQLDVANSLQLKKELGKVFRRKSPFEIDGASVERVDTAGLQVLVAFRAEARNRDIDLVWAAASDTLRKSAKLLGLTNVLEPGD